MSEVHLLLLPVRVTETKFQFVPIQLGFLNHFHRSLSDRSKWVPVELTASWVKGLNFLNLVALFRLNSPYGYLKPFKLQMMNYRRVFLQINSLCHYFLLDKVIEHNFEFSRDFPAHSLWSTLLNEVIHLVSFWEHSKNSPECR